MPMPRKYKIEDMPAVGTSIECLEKMAEYAYSKGDKTLGDEVKKQVSVLYDYMARTLSRRGGEFNDTSERNKTIRMRGMQKRIAQLEEKLLLIRCSTDLHERGNRTSDNGPGNRCQRQARRIDHLEAKLLIIREMSDTNEAVLGHQPSKVGAPSRQIHDARIRVDVEKGLHGRRKPIVNPEKGRLLQSVLEDKGESNEESQSN